MITLNTLEKATPQEVFDQVARHLLTQNAKAYDESRDRCMYRTGRLKCAAGCLIADDEYQQRFEGIGSWPSLVEEGIAPAAHMTLISRLQDVHDHGEPDQWHHDLALIAMDFKLNTKVLG